MRSILPITGIYNAAAKAAGQLQDRAENASTLAKEDADKLTCKDIVYAASRFKLKAEKAAVTVPALRNDGTLRAFCEQFDKVFNVFMLNAIEFEKELERIESEQ